MDTIHALASGAVPSGVAVIRVSGPDARTACERITGETPRPGLVGLRALRHPETGALLDHGLVLWFAGPRSFTGEDVLELHVHGGPAVVEAVSDALEALPGLRPAERGEFTRRAFENGRMDLTEVEGLADLIASETEAQRRLAVAQEGGALRRLYEGWAERLLHARAMLEAEFDFADEDDVPDDAARDTLDAVRTVANEMRAHLGRGRDGEIVRDGLRVALLGPPNAGKSSLLNAMVERDAAIVSDVPGTTRDVVEVVLERSGMRVIVSDTAGLRDATDVVEREGVRRARKAAERADLRLWLSPADAPAPPEVDDVTVLASRADLAPTDLVPAEGPAVSVRAPDGLADLWRIVDERLTRLRPDGEALPTRARHRRGVRDALVALEEAIDAPLDEVRADRLRAAADALGRITGRTDVEDLLGAVFAEFCVGK